MKKVIYVPLFVLLATVLADSQVIPRITGRPARLQPSSQQDVAGLFVVGEVKGNVPTKAIMLPKPDYPAEARWVGVEGVVRLGIEIDKEGNVVSTAFVSGPEELRLSSEDAARRSRFRIAKNASNEPVPAVGELVYTYQIRKASWSAIGWGLSGLEFLPTSTLPLPAVRKALAPAWTAEHASLDRIDQIRGKQPPKSAPLLVRSAPTSSISPSGSRSVVRGQIILPEPPSDEQRGLAAQLLSDLRGKLLGDPLASWELDLGTKLRGVIDDFRNPSVSAVSVQELIRSAPSTGADRIIGHLREMETVLGRSRDPRAMNDLARLISAILAGD